MANPKQPDLRKEMERLTMQRNALKDKYLDLTREARDTARQVVMISRRIQQIQVELMNRKP